MAAPDNPRPKQGWLRRWLKRFGLTLALLLLVVVVFYAQLVDVFGGDYAFEPEDLAENASPEALALVEAAFGDVELSRMLDVHAHLAGMGTNGSGCEANPKMTSWLHPKSHFMYDLYLSAGGVEDLANADQEYVDRLARLARHSRVRRTLLAFDRHYDEDGQVDARHSEFHVPNEWMWKVVQASPDQFVPCISVHPYRADALLELDRWARRGVRLVKWLPNAMGIDPANERCRPYYERMVQHDMVLLSHAGLELAVEARELQELGNPLRLRLPLDCGLRVIVAHCAGLGSSVDLDDPARPSVPSFELWLRLMDEERYAGLLFGDLSATTLINRLNDSLSTLLERTDLHHRLLDGTDYPLPAARCTIWTGTLARRGYLAEEDVEPLNELYDYNPLLYDYVLKRRLRHPDSGRRFAPEAFQIPSELGAF